MGTRGLLRIGRASACALLLLAPAAAWAGPPSLTHAEALYEIHDAAGAARELRALLALRPPAQVAAIAHVYLGMVALEAHTDPAAARAELILALKLDPTVTIPQSAAPEDQQLFDQVRVDLRTAAEGKPVPQAEAALGEPSPAAPATAVAAGRPATGHGAWPWVLGVAAIAAGSVATWGFLQMAADSSAAAQSHSQPVSLAQAQAAVSQGQLGLGVGIAAAVAAAALALGVGLTW